MTAHTLFQNQKVADNIKREEPAEINFQSEQVQKETSAKQEQEEAIKTMPKDIVKAKMSGTVSVPKETVEINDANAPAKKLPSDVGNKIDPYREKIGK